MSNYPLFSVIGLEIEYMLVDKDTLNIVPKSDVILTELAGKLVNEVALGDIVLSNELVMHVLEFKNNGPKASTPEIAKQFHQAILQAQPILDSLNIQLLPTGAHPWINPDQETRRWPHDNNEIYTQYDRIFNCQGHGWSNLQSMHVNLPYANDHEFSQLHNSVRLLLPLLPALAASSPILEGKYTGMLDSRLYFYNTNQQKIPSISGNIIPEFIRAETEYQQRILDPMYKAISPYDPAGILQHEWLNSRGAIPKFNFKAIEIRIIDSQECPDADIAIALAIQMLLKNWCQHSDYYLENPCDTARLKSVYDACIYDGLSTTVEDSELCRQWQIPKRSMNIRTIWSQLLERYCSALDAKSQSILEQILIQGNLSDRILQACNNNYTKQALMPIYRNLSDCLLHNKTFTFS